MRRSSRSSFGSLVLLLACASCADPQIRGSSPGGGNAGGSGVNTERPGGGNAGGSGNTSGPAPVGGGGGGFTLPDPVTAPAQPDAAPIQCAAEAHKAEIVPLDLMLLVDSSGSMTGSAGMRSKWETAQSALKSFVADPMSSGLGVGLQFFPLEKPCNNDRDCVPSAMTMDSYCKGKQVCAGPMGPGPMPRSCGASPVIIIGPIGGNRCATGETCQTVGYCSGTGVPCTNLNQACPMGGGMCEGTPKVCTIGASGSECEETRYEAPTVTIESLPMAQPALTRALNRKEPNGGTPMGPAVRGVLKHLQQRLQANPGRKVALVLASDGLPGACDRNDIPSIAMDLSAAFMATPSIPTYIIGVFSSFELARAQPQLDQLAMGGGTSKAFVLTAQDDLNMRLLEALNQIRGAALACEYKIPQPMKGDLDFGKVNVRYTSAAGPENIPYVERMDRCDPMRGGWYYDVHPSMGKPSRVMVCPATCTRFKTEKSSQVELVFGCATGVIN
jgi:hypothetical protein